MSAGYVTNADLGGQTGHGPIEMESEGVLFHHDWEAKALALTLASGAAGRWNIDMGRRYRETLPNYADLTYYEIWTAALERLLVDRGLLSEQELAEGRAIDDSAEVRGVLTADRVEAAMRSGGPAERPVDSAARFAVGDRVRTRAGSVEHHTRLPSYVVDRVGTVELVHGGHVFPDANAHDQGEQPQWLYTVVFDAADLWPEARRGDQVSVDAWESYLSMEDA
jgi:nitrile hydratase